MLQHWALFVYPVVANGFAPNGPLLTKTPSSKCARKGPDQECGFPDRHPLRAFRTLWLSVNPSPPSGGTSWKAQVGLVAICTLFLLNTPLCFFWWFFFRNVTKLYEFRNDTCFLSVRLRNLTGHVITPFLAFGMLRKLTDCVTILPFDFRHVTECHGLYNNASFWSYYHFFLIPTRSLLFSVTNPSYLIYILFL